MRKKPYGSAPYEETWYLFGGVLTPKTTPDEAIKNELLIKAVINISVTNKISWDTEIKHDLDGIEKFFVYLDVLCEYESGELRLSDGIEKLEWLKPEDLKDYDIVPPSRVLFKRLGYME